jgi:hypothetical protein
VSRGAFGEQQLGADLRAVAVREDDAVAVSHQPHDLGGDAAGVRGLPSNGARLSATDERISTDCQDHRCHG